MHVLLQRVEARVEVARGCFLRCGALRAHAGDVPRETLKEAVSEIVDYTGRCVAAAQRLSHLAPIPLTAIVEDGLVRYTVAGRIDPDDMARRLTALLGD